MTSPNSVSLTDLGDGRRVVQAYNPDRETPKTRQSRLTP
jgi:hypothetical protein